MSRLVLTVREEENISIVELVGDVDAHTAMQMESALEKLVGEKKYNIIVNCKGLKYISSAGLGVFMAFIEIVRKNQGDIKLSNVPPRAYHIIDLFGFPTLIEIFKEEREAIEKFRNI